MNMYVDALISVPLLVVLVQFYLYVLSSDFQERNRKCQTLGVIYAACGTALLMLKEIPLAVLGLLLIAFGLRLITQGFDRLEKTIYINQVEEDI